jgi:adenylate cyclase
MPSITFLPDNITKEIRADETILDVAQRFSIPLMHICQGNARCSTCRVIVVEGKENVSPLSAKEQIIAGQMAFSKEIRLACQTKISGDVKVRRLVLDEEDMEVTSLLISESKSNMVGFEKEVLILFADIRGFTPMTETLLPYDVVHILNRYFHFMNQVITRHGGHINNYMGDGFLALFDVEATEQDMLRGITAGLEMLDVVKQKISPYVRTYFGRNFKIGIGLHHGLVVAGAIGGRDSKKHTIIGDAVNVTSRIELCNKQLGTEFLISEEVYVVIQNRVKVNLFKSISIPGKAGLHTLYEVVGLAKE